LINFLFGNSEIPKYLFLAGLDSIITSKTARFSQLEPLRWLKFQRMVILRILKFETLIFTKLPTISIRNFEPSIKNHGKVMTFNKIIASVTLVVFSLSSLAAPTITTTAGTAATSGIAYTYTASATDSNSQPLTWTAPTLPSWLNFSASGLARAVDFVNSAGGQPGGVGYDEVTGITYYGTLGGSTIYKVDAAGNKSAFGVQPSPCYPYGSFVIRNSRLYVPCYSAVASSIVSYDLTDTTGSAAATNLHTGTQGFIALAVRNNVLYASNFSQSKIYTVDWNTGAITLFWDTSTDGVTGPYGMMVDSNGDLYVAAYGSGNVKKKSLSGTVSTLVSSGSATTDIKKGLNGKFYVSNAAGSLKIYPPDFSTPETVNVRSWGMTFNNSGTLILGDAISKLVKIETGAVLYGTPTVANAGVHPVSLSVTDGTTPATQNFSITVIAEPSVTTGSASGLTATGATLGGTVSSNGAASTVTFEYGLTSSYGSTATAAESPLASSASAASVSASVTGLTCGTTYHYRVKAVNSVNTTYGSDATFSTGSCQTNAVCGTAASVASSIVPTGNLCTAGTAGQVSSSQGQYSWTCSGIGGGTNASCTAPWASNAGTGSGSLTASGNNWTVSSASFAATPTATPPAGVTFPNGILDLQLSTTGTAGTDATVVVQYTTAVPAGAVYMKYGKTAANQTDHWYQLDASRAVFASDRMSVTLTLTDGGAGDHDLLANGTIVDPGGPALVPAPTAVPTLSEWAMIFLASLMGMFAFARIRRQS
jgi:hypothetical protein